MTKIGFVEPPSRVEQWITRLGWAWTAIALLVAIPLATVFRVFCVQPAADPGVLKRRSSLKAVEKQHYRVSSMGAVAKTRLVAKRWAQKMREAASTEATSGAVWEMSIEASRQRLIEELTWQTYCLAPLSKADLALLNPTERDVALGDRVYRLVALLEPTQAGKVTGMLLELENDELLQMIAADDVVSAAGVICRWTAEAIGVLKEASPLLQSPSTPQTPRTPSFPPPPPPSPEQDEWKVVTHRRRSRSKSREPPSFSHAELQHKLATPAAGAA